MSTCIGISVRTICSGEAEGRCAGRGGGEAGGGKGCGGQAGDDGDVRGASVRGVVGRGGVESEVDEGKGVVGEVGFETMLQGVSERL